jgi:hypothetical protein
MTIEGITLYHVVPSRSCRVLWLLNVSASCSLSAADGHTPAHPSTLHRCHMRRVVTCVQSSAISSSQGPHTALLTMQELGLPVKLIDTNFLKDPSVLEGADFKGVNPAGKCAHVLCTVLFR